MQNLLQYFTQTEKFYLLIIALVSIAVMMPVFFNGIPYGYDLPHHYQCAMTFYESILNGDFYPSWSLNRNFGYGGMESRLYPPVSHYTLALFYLLFGDWHIASWVTFTFFTFIGGLGVYLWAKEYMPSNQAVFAGCIYTLLPYHLNQIYNTFFYAEFVGSSILPFTFVFISRVCKRGKTSDVIGLIISFAALILTHLPLTVIGAICFTIYGLTLLKRHSSLSQIIKLSIGVIGGLVASSFFWTKVLLEKDLMAKMSIYADPWLDYRLHFLLTPIQIYEGDLQTRIYETATFFYDLMLLYAVILAIGCTIPFLIWEKQSKIKVKSIWILFAVSVFLVLPFSQFVWDKFPLLQEVQFPWRWVAVICIFASVISASQLNHLIEWFRNKNRPFALLICGCILTVVTFSVSQIIRQAPYIEKQRVTEYMQKNSKDIGFTFWWTVWTKKEAFDIKEKVLANNREVTIQKWTATNREFQISEGSATEARIATFYHPNWKAEVNGIATEIKPDENGAIIVTIPNQSANVRIFFQEAYLTQIGNWISVLFWIGLLFFAIYKFGRYWRTINLSKF